MTLTDDEFKRLKELSRGSPQAAVDPNILAKLKQEIDRREAAKASLQQLSKEVQDHQAQSEHQAKFSDKGTKGTLQDLSQQVIQGAAQKPNIRQQMRDEEEAKITAETLARPEHQAGAV